MTADTRRAPSRRCKSEYRESGRRFCCYKKVDHDGKHGGWSVGRSREWTDEQAEK